jgi:N6-L-threonylcarbamoyladenine synthase
MLAGNLAPLVRGNCISLGIEGSANKIGVGIISFNESTCEYSTLANPRKTYITAG